MKSSKPKLLKDLINQKNAILILENGDYYWGHGIGAKGQTIGELCFNTSMTGYQEIITDPSYAEQIITFTFPHIGNTGTNINDNESKFPVAKGVILKANVTFASNFRSDLNLNEWLKNKNIIGIQGIDTRSITALIRENGYINGMIINEVKGNLNIKEKIKSIKSWKGLEGADLASTVSCQKKYVWKDSADDDEAGLGKGFDQVATQARHLSYAFGTDGGDIKTVDGKNIPVTQDEAKYLSQFAGNAVSALYPLFGIEPTFARDPEARDKATEIFSTSDGVMKVLDKFRLGRK